MGILEAARLQGVFEPVLEALLDAQPQALLLAAAITLTGCSDDGDDSIIVGVPVMTTALQ